MELKPRREAPTQLKLKDEIGVINSQISNFRALENSGLSLVSKKDVQNLVATKQKKEKKLSTLEYKAKWEQKKRKRVKETLNSLRNASEQNANALKFMTRGIPGRPSIETDQPQLLSTILDIVRESSSADERRRSEALRSVTTLDDLQSKLIEHGFKLSRATTYLRLMPRRGNTTHAKRHVKTVPVKLCR